MKHLDGHELYIPCSPGDTDAVIPYRPGNTRHVCAVHVVVQWGVVDIDKVPASDVIDKAIAIVIKVWYSVELCLVDPYIGL